MEIMEIIGFSDYLIYKDGRVFSKKSNKFMKEKESNCGYKYVSLCNRGEKPINKTIHRLLATHFIPNPENKPQVDHIDRNRTNNRIENLRWATRQENQENRGLHKNNTSGHKYIYWNTDAKKWFFRFQGRNKILKRFHCKTEALCYKFYYLLKINYINKKFDK